MSPSAAFVLGVVVGALAVLGTILALALLVWWTESRRDVRREHQQAQRIATALMRTAHPSLHQTKTARQHVDGAGRDL